jgi:hypothetical protein
MTFLIYGDRNDVAPRVQRAPLQADDDDDDELDEGLMMMMMMMMNDDDDDVMKVHVTTDSFFDSSPVVGCIVFAPTMRRQLLISTDSFLDSLPVVGCVVSSSQLVCCLKRLMIHH